MWKTVIILGCSIGAVLATPIGLKNMPIMADEEMQMQKSEMAMTTLNLPSNATSIRADITDGFTCTNKTYGYYADVENECQIFHVCLPVIYPDGRENTFRWSFICPEETLFSQESFTCVRGEDMNFDCDQSEKFYDLNRNFGMTPDSSMEMSSMEADMDEYYMKTDLGSSALTKLSEDIPEQILPLIKPVEKKTENQQHISPVKPHKVPLRTTATKLKPEPSKKPTGTSTTKRVYTKNYNKVRRPLRPQNPSTKAPQQIRIELPAQVAQTEATSTMKIDTQRPTVTIKAEEPQKLVHDVEEIILTKVMENAQKEDDAARDQVQILNDEAPVMIEEFIQNIETPTQEKINDMQLEDTNKLTDNSKRTEDFENKVNQNDPEAISNVEEQMKGQSSTEKEAKIEQMADNTKTESATEQLIKEQITNESLPEEVITSENTKENEDIQKISAVGESTIEDLIPTETNSKTHINGQAHIEEEKEIQVENKKSQEENLEIKEPLSELDIEKIPEVPSTPEDEIKNDMSSKEQEDMIIKTITDLMNAANLLSTEKLSISEETSTISNLSTMSDVVNDIENAKSQSTSNPLQAVMNEKPASDTVVQLNEEILTIPGEDTNKEENSEIVQDTLLNQVGSNNNINNAESDQYNVQRPSSMNALEVEENKNELESDNLNKGAESFLPIAASEEKEAPIVQTDESVSSSEKNFNENEQNIEIVESLPTQDVLDEEPLADQMLEIKPEETPKTENHVPIHDLLMSQPSQPYITLSNEMNGQFSNEQVIPVFIIQDEVMNSETTGNSENKPQKVETVKEGVLDDSPQEDEEIKPIYQRIKEFHSNLLKTDLLSADLDDEPAVHEIPNNSEIDKSTLDKQEEKQMDVSIENLPSESALDFLAQIDASKDFLKVTPLETENMETSPEPAISNSNGQEAEIKLKQEIIAEDTNDTPLKVSKTSRRLQKKMDPRKRRFLFRADIS